MTKDTKQIIIRLTEQKKYLLRVQAAHKNMSINQYLNWLIEQQIDESAVSHQQASYTTMSQ